MFNVEEKENQHTEDDAPNRRRHIPTVMSIQNVSERLQKTNSSFTILYELKTNFPLSACQPLAYAVLFFLHSSVILSVSLWWWRTYTLWSLCPLRDLSQLLLTSPTLQRGERNLTLWHHKSHLNVSCFCMGTRCSRGWGCWGARRVVIFGFITVGSNRFYPSQRILTEYHGQRFVM